MRYIILIISEKYVNGFTEAIDCAHWGIDDIGVKIPLIRIKMIITKNMVLKLDLIYQLEQEVLFHMEVK